MSLSLKDIEKVDPTLVDRFLKCAKNYETMPQSTQNNTIDILLQILMSLIGSSANKPFATLTLETLFKFLKNGKPACLTFNYIV